MKMKPQLLALVAVIVTFGCAAGQGEVACPDDPVSPAPELAYTKTIEGVSSMDEALQKVEEALKAQGFGVVTRIDFQKTMKAKLDEEIKPYHVLGACHARSAFEALQQDDRAGLLLPCKVAVYQQDDGSIAVSFARPEAVFSLLGASDSTTLVDSVDEAIRAAFDSL